MKKSLVSIVAAGLVTTLGSGVAGAQNAPPRMIPVDIIPCTYHDGKGPADLERAVSAWQEFVEDTDTADDYSAWTLTKQYAGADQQFDFIWLGAWRDANAMGAGWSNYRENGGEVAAGFAEVANCTDVAANFVSINHRPTPDNNTPGDGVLIFADCKRKKGMTNAHVAKAMKEWSAVLDANDIDAGIFHWYPVFGGGGEQTFHFKEIIAVDSMEALGSMYEKITNGGLYVQNDAIRDPVMSCDVARVYHAKNRLSNNIRK